MTILVASKLMSLNRCFQLYNPFYSKSTSKIEATAGAQAQKLMNNNNTKRINGSFWRLTRHCSPLDSSGVINVEEEEEEGYGIMCEACSGRGWLVCNFCNGQKTNVKSETNRIFRRCPTCKAVGCILCQKCKVFKCVTYPDFSDGQL